MAHYSPQIMKMVAVAKTHPMLYTGFRVFLGEHSRAG